MLNLVEHSDGYNANEVALSSVASILLLVPEGG